MTNQQIAEAICETAVSDYTDLIEKIWDEMMVAYSESELDEIGEIMLDEGIDTAERCRIKRPKP